MRFVIRYKFWGPYGVGKELISNTISPTGSSGGLIFILSSNLFLKLHYTCSRYFLVVSDLWKGAIRITTLVYDYGP